MRDFAELQIDVGQRPITAGKQVIRQPPTAIEVREFEREFGIKLPDDYLAFLQFANGGHPQRGCFRPKDSRHSGYWSVNLFFHLSDDRSDFISLWRNAADWRDFADFTIIPIADDPCGDPIVLAYESAFPSIKLVVEEVLVIDVADSFSEFVDLLEDDVVE